jgi:hypothetical protein
MLNATQFNKGYDMTELLSAALLDMNWHGIVEPVDDVDAFEAAALKKKAWIFLLFHRAIAAAISPISSAAAMRLAIMRICGHKCWRTMAISGLLSRAG